MLTGGFRGEWCNCAPIAAPKPDNMLLSGCGMTAAAFARRETTNHRGPTKGPLIATSRAIRGEASGRSFEHTSIQEHVK